MQLEIHVIIPLSMLSIFQKVYVANMVITNERSYAIHVHKHSVEAMLLQQYREVTAVILSIIPWYAYLYGAEPH